MNITVNDLVKKIEQDEVFFKVNIGGLIFNCFMFLLREEMIGLITTFILIYLLLYRMIENRKLYNLIYGNRE